MSLRTLQSLFAYKAWANEQLFKVLSTVPAGEAEALTTCTRTLNHIYVVDRIFRAHLAGEPRPFDATNTRELPSLAKLCGDAAATDAWYVSYLSTLREEALPEVLDFTFTDGDAGRMSREEILLHVTAHGAYHRGNVGQVLKSLSITPPRDLYTKFLHTSEPQRRHATVS
jgi:uncharacterized damage-inducible protein DinB